jgi:diguanylate cyclase (GGDEF)-like protein
MMRRIAAVGAPPLLLMISVFLMVHYHALIIDVVWGGTLPHAWRNVVRQLPLVLAAAGVVAGLRMRSCGVIIVMLTLGTAAGLPVTGARLGIPPAGQPGGVPPFWLLWMPVNYLLGLWALRHSWRSRRGWAALTTVLVWSGITFGAATSGRTPGAALMRHLADGRGMLPAGFPGREFLGPGALPAVIVAVFLAGFALVKHDPVPAALSTSLILLLPPVTRGLEAFSLGIVSCAAVLVVWIGLWEAMLALAYRDGLTGLPARRGLNDALRQLGRRYAVAMLDVDHFKRFNDRFGHRTGDDVLKMIAARLLRIPGGRAFRYGGEEFAVIFRGRSTLQAVTRMDRFRETLAGTPFVIRHLPRASKKARGGRTSRLRSRQQVRITVSVGVATPAKGCRQASEVLAAADKALYRAKHKGRNQVVAAGTATRRPDGG